MAEIFEKPARIKALMTIGAPVPPPMVTILGDLTWVVRLIILGLSMDESKEVDFKTKAVPRRSFLKAAGVGLAALFLGKPGKEDLEVAKPPETSQVPPPKREPPTIGGGQPLVQEMTVPNEIKEVMAKMEISAHPANLNVLGVNDGGVALVDKISFKAYWGERWKAFQEKSQAAFRQERDRMFGQLSQSVENLMDRGLDFDKRDGGRYGLGFSKEDFEVFNDTRGENSVKEKGYIFRKGKDGYTRGWALTSGEDLKFTIKEYAEEYLKIKGNLRPNENEIGGLTEKIMKGDLGITKTEKGFKAHETYLGEPDAEGKQKETTVEVEFRKGVEVPGLETERETIKKQDIKNSMLLTWVFNKETEDYRVEVFALSSTPDPGKPDRDRPFKTAIAHAGPFVLVSCDGGRLVPPGDAPVVVKEELNSGKPGENPEKPKDSTIPKEEKPKEPPPDDSTIPQNPPPEENKDEDKPIGNPGNAKDVGKAGEKGSEFNPPPEGPGTKGKSDNPDKDKGKDK